MIIKFTMKRVMQAPLDELKHLTRYFSEEFTQLRKPEQQMLSYSEFSNIEPVLRQMATEITQHAQELLESEREQQAANKAKSVAESANRAKSSFVSRISTSLVTRVTSRPMGFLSK